MNEPILKKGDIVEIAEDLYHTEYTVLWVVGDKVQITDGKSYAKLKTISELNLKKSI